MENKCDPSNSLKRTWVQSKGNSKAAILGRAVGIRERMNRDRRQHELHSIIYLHILLLLLLSQSQILVQGDLYTVNKLYDISIPFLQCVWWETLTQASWCRRLPPERARKVTS